jgi:hypothetical protein
MTRFGAKRALQMLAIGVVASLAATTTMAAAQAKKELEINPKTLKVLKTLAWQSLPSKIIMSDKRVVEIDKKDPSQIIIPDEDAVRIIKAAHLTARAQQCDLQELVIANRDAIMKAEKASNKWSESQLHYINTLHLYTVQLLVGKIEVMPEGKGGKQEVTPPEIAKTPPVQCSDKEKKDILAAVEANEKAAGKS